MNMVNELIQFGPIMEKSRLWFSCCFAPELFPLLSLICSLTSACSGTIRQEGQIWGSSSHGQEEKSSPYGVTKPQERLVMVTQLRSVN